MTETALWAPKQHIERACELLDQAEAQFKVHPEGMDFTNVALAMAKVHIDTANAKMTGRMRA